MGNTGLDGSARDAAMKEYRLTLAALQARQGIPPGKAEEIAVGCAITAYLSHASVTPPEGYVLVPKEPTEAMKAAGTCLPDAPGYSLSAAIYRAMISASPVAGEGNG